MRVQMERLRNMGLRRSFFLLSAGCLAAALLLTAAIYSVCDRIGRGIPRGGIAIAYDCVVTELEEPSPEQLHVLRILGWVQTLTVLLFPVSGLGIAGVLFYRWKLKEPIRILKEGTERIRMQDLDFSIPVVSADELGGICAAFEIMRLEQMPVRRKAVDGALLRQELEETAELLAAPRRPSVRVSVEEQCVDRVYIDHGIFLTVAENLIGNAVRFARQKVRVCLRQEGGFLTLSVEDDGPGYPAALLRDGPKPFGKASEDGAHFGMGLYSSQVLCRKHGGELRLENRAKEEGGGARIMAVFGEK